MRVYLVNAANDDTSATANDKTFPAAGVLSLASAVKLYRPDVEVYARDGQVYALENIFADIKCLKPDVVGISVLGTSYQNSLKIAEAAKNSGATTVFGNDHAAIMAKNILNSRDVVDYICIADAGEYPFLEILEFLEGRRKISEVSKLAYRTNQGITMNHGPEMPLAPNSTILDSIPTLDRTLYPQSHWNEYRDNYWQRYAKTHHGENVKGVDTINRARGCSRFKDACLFCGIADLSMRLSSPEMFWREVLTGMQQTNANIFYEAFDSMSSAPGWIRRLVVAKPKNAENARFFVYTQALETTRNLVELYKDLGVYRVNMGYESGDDNMLKRLKGPKDSVQQNKNASLMYRDSDIRIYGSLVLGGPGETHKTLQRSVDFARWAVDNDVIAAIEAQPLFPEMNARAGKWLMNPDLAISDSEKMGFSIRDRNLLFQMPSKYRSRDDQWFGDEIAKDWTEIFCNVSYDDLLNAAREIRSYAAKHGYAEGSGVSKEL
ncbi:MAG: radical SAM protein [Candidatus Aenigmarchaeota archaeon]|nr:radical SAM protein [Candidatus Aenigmarchaeota archaeon]